MRARMVNVIELKRPFFVLFLVSLLLSIASVARLNAFAAVNSKTIDVPKDYPTIQDAINNASDGDTVFVEKGTYNEDIEINKTVSLLGEDPDLTIINGAVSTYAVRVTADGVSIEGFTISAHNATVSSVILYSAGNKLENDRIENGYYGLVLSSSASNTISGNTILNNTYGVESQYSTDNVFSDNDVVNRAVGIDLYSSDSNVFSGNTIYNNTQGIDLYSSNGNVFRGNSIYNNEYGVSLQYSFDKNVFYHNNFNNTFQVYYSGSVNSTNVWSFDGEGNYWSDYVGQDLYGVGIGDTPYNHTDTEEGDSYPLMGPFYDLDVVLGNTTYSVNLISNSSISGLTYELGAETGNKILLFNAVSEEGTAAFCRIMIPLGLMESPFIVLSAEGEITPKVLNASNETNAYLYFTWVNSNETISIISSEAMRLYDELLDNYTGLLSALYNLSAANSALLQNYSALLNSLLNLQDRYSALNSSYNEHLSDYSKNVENLRNLMYIFAATTAIFLVAIAYLSKRAGTSVKKRAVDRGSGATTY
jgi:parallel beta-helix repeat protein